MDFVGVAELCAPNVHVDTMHRIATVESAFNPYAIGVVGGRLERQPKTLEEAVATAQALETGGYNYSLGLVQVNKKNFPRYGLNLTTAFDICENLRAGSAILEDCYRRAPRPGRALTDAFSCYYSGSFTAGYKLGYVEKVRAATPPPSLADYRPATIPVVPRLTPPDTTTPINPQILRVTVPALATPEPLFVSARPEGRAETSPPPLTPPAPSSALLF